MNDRAAQRVLGAKDAIANAGFNPGEMHIIEIEYSIDNGREAFQQLGANAGCELPSLVICGNDVLAVGVIKAAQEKGLKVPHDLSVIGFDDIELSTVVHPELTTVHVPHEDMGRIAGETLYALVHEGAGPTQIDLDTYIVERNSLAAPKSG